MSYSRWGGSYWYTFHACAEEGVVEDRDNAKFEVCSLATVTAKEIRDDLEACIKRVAQVETTPHEIWRRGQANEADYEELRGYMREFLADIDERHPKGQ